MMWGHGWGWGYWLGTGITMILFWALVILAIVALVRYLLGTTRGPGRGGPGGGQTRAEEVLAERFARGEIDEEEYKRRLEVLRPSRNAGRLDEK